MEQNPNLFLEILIKVLQGQQIDVTFPNLAEYAKPIVELTSYKALQEIKAIIENDDLSDFACVEEIVRIFERIGSDGGNRHDF